MASIRLVRAGLQGAPGSGLASFATTAQSYAGGTGALSIVSVKWEGAATAITATDTAGNSYTATATVTDSAKVAAVYKIGGTGNGSNAVTVSFTGGNADFVNYTYENFDGIASLDTSTSNHASSGTAVTCGSLTPTNPYSLSWICYGAFSSEDYTVNSGFIESQDGGDNGCSYRIHDRSTAYNPSVTQGTNAAWCAIHLVFNASGTADPVWIGSWGAKSTGNGTSSSVAYPTGLQAGNLIVCCVPSKHANLPALSGFTQLNQVTDGSGTGADSGSVVSTVFYKVSDGTESGTLAVTKTTETGSGCFGQMFRFVGSTGSSATWAPVSTTGADSSTGTGVSATGAADPGVAAGDFVLASFADVSDIGTNAWTSPSLTETGVTYGDIDVAQVNLDGIGDDMRLAVYGARATAGPSSAAPVFSATANGSAGNSHRGACVFAVLHLVTSSPLSGTSPSSTWGEAGALTGAGAAALSGTRSSSTWGEAGALTGAGSVALAGTRSSSTWGEAGTLAATTVALAGTRSSSTWGEAGTLAVAGAAALSGTRASSTWGEAGALTGAGAAALAGAASSSTWGEAGTLSGAGSVALSSAQSSSTWGQGGALAAVTVALAGTSPVSTWGQDGDLTIVDAGALVGTSPSSTWGHAGVLAGSGAAALAGTPSRSTWSEAGTLAATTVALAGGAPVSTWGHAGLLYINERVRPGSARYTPGMKFRGRHLISPYKKRRNE